MNRRAIPIGPQSRATWVKIGDDLVERLEPRFHGVVIKSDLTNGSISVDWEMDRDAAPFEPHESRAVGAALIAAADDVAAYKVKP